MVVITGIAILHHSSPHVRSRQMHQGVRSDKRDLLHRHEASALLAQAVFCRRAEALSYNTYP